MIILLLVSLLALLITRYQPKRDESKGLKIAFLLLAFVISIRCNYGNDYFNYLYAYNNIIQLNNPFDSYVSNGINEIEPGWKLLNWLCKPFGFQGFIAILSFIMSYFYYRFIKDNVPPKYYIIAIFVYLFEWSMFPLQLSMLRQGLVISAFAFLFKYIKERRWLISLIILFICTTIHKTALILLPFAFWGYLPINNKKIISLIFAIISIISFSNIYFLEYIYSFLLKNEAIEQYGMAYGVDEGIISISMIVHIFPLVIALYYTYTASSQKIDYYSLILPCVSLFLIPFVQITQILSRFSFYFEIFCVLQYPILFAVIKNACLKYSLCFLIAVSILYKYYQFFVDSIYSSSFLIYKTIFD